MTRVIVKQYVFDCKAVEISSTNTVLGSIFIFPTTFIADRIRSYMIFIYFTKIKFIFICFNKSIEPSSFVSKLSTKESVSKEKVVFFLSKKDLKIHNKRHTLILCLILKL